MACLAEYLDDCWEPDSAVETLGRLAGDTRAGTPICLRVAGGDLDHARVVSADFEGDWTHQEPGSARYLWILWAGPPPTREWMIARYNEFLADLP